MKTYTILAIVCFGFGFSAFAGEELVLPPEITTVSGKSYKSVTVLKVLPDSIKISHEYGVATIPLIELPPEIKDKIPNVKSDFDFSKRKWEQPSMDSNDTAAFFDNVSVLSSPRGEFETEMERNQRLKLIAPEKVYFFITDTQAKYNIDLQEMSVFGGRIENGSIEFCSTIVMGRDALRYARKKEDAEYAMEIAAKSKVRKSGFYSLLVKPTNIIPRDLFGQAPKRELIEEGSGIYEEPYTTLYFKVKMPTKEAEAFKNSLKIVCGVSFPKAFCKVDENRYDSGDLKLTYTSIGNIVFIGLVKFQDNSNKDGEMLASWTNQENRK